jgi:hypothetical protein
MYHLSETDIEPWGRFTSLFIRAFASLLCGSKWCNQHGAPDILSATAGLPLPLTIVGVCAHAARTRQAQRTQHSDTGIGPRDGRQPAASGPTRGGSRPKAAKTSFERYCASGADDASPRFHTRIREFLSFHAQDPVGRGSTSDTDAAMTSTSSGSS